MTIDELNALTTLTAADEVPVWDSEESGEPTKKITASNLAASVKSLASLPSTTEMNAAIAQSTATMKSANIATGFNVHRVGNTVMCACTTGNYNVPSANSYVRDANNNVLAAIPDGFRPAPSNTIINVLDTLNSLRLTLSYDEGNSAWRFRGPTAFTNSGLRFTAVWLTTDAMPT